MGNVFRAFVAANVVADGAQAQVHADAIKRPEYIAHRDFTPIECLPDDCLVKDYPVDLPWRDGVPASALQTSMEEFKLAA